MSDCTQSRNTTRRFPVFRGAYSKDVAGYRDLRPIHAHLRAPSDPAVRRIRLGFAYDAISPDGELLPPDDAVARREAAFKAWKLGLWAAAFATSRLDPQYLKVANIRAYSGLCCIDVDHLAGPRASVEGRDAISSHPSCALAFVSPSLLGYKAILRVPVADDAAAYRRIYNAAKAAVESHTGCEVDGSGKDASRLCFLPPDADARLNLDAMALAIPDDAPSEPAFQRRPSCVDGAKPELALALIDHLPPYPPKTGSRDRALPIGWALCGLSGGDEETRLRWKAKLEQDGRGKADRLWTADDWRAKASTHAGALFNELTRNGVSVRKVAAGLTMRNGHG